MRLSGWTLIFPSQKSHSDRLLGRVNLLTAQNLNVAEFRHQQGGSCSMLYLDLHAKTILHTEDAMEVAANIDNEFFRRKWLGNSVTQ